ncbi:MAG: GspH/FimT family pseudopilin [Gammaproteobacteria bacterium]
MNGLCALAACGANNLLSFHHAPAPGSTLPRGFTLIELLVTMAIAVVLVTLAVPAFTNFVLDARLTAAVNRFIHGMHVARHEALLAEAEVVVCRSADGRQCRNSGSWTDGLLVFVNNDRDYPPKVDTGERILQVEPALPMTSIQANRSAFVFRPWGMRSVNGTLTFCDRRGFPAARAVIVSYTGRPRATSAATANGAMSCPT